MRNDTKAKMSQMGTYDGDNSGVSGEAKENGDGMENSNFQIMEYARALNRTLYKLKSRNKKLAALALQLSNAEERERQKIAEDLHDNIGQMLAMAKVKLQELRKSVTSEDSRRVDEIDGLIQNAISFARSMTFEISPNALIEIGFVEAVEWLVEHIHEKHGLDITYSHSEQADPADTNTSTILFKAIRELLINTVKHSGSARAEVIVKNDRNNVLVIVRDDGTGFDQSAINREGRNKMKFGLFNLRHRIIDAEGSVDIDSSSGRGTTIVLTVPNKNLFCSRKEVK